MKLEVMWPKNITLLFIYSFPKYIQRLSHQAYLKEKKMYFERQVICKLLNSILFT